MNMATLIPLIFLAACSTPQVTEPPAHTESKKPPVPTGPVDVAIKPGEVAKIRFPVPTDTRGQELFCKDRRIPFFVEGDGASAFVAETYFSDGKPSECRIGGRRVANIEVVDKTFPEERLNVARKMVFPSKRDQARIRREQKFLNKNYASSGDVPLFDSPFRIPLDTFVTSIYGSRRLFNDKKRTQHLGTDFRAKTGRPITSSNAGRVVVARSLYYTGNTVTVDHGLGIFTIYGHLSKLHVKEGQTVRRGQLLGDAGATGRTTGPHLHWGVKVNGHFVEGSSLVRESQK